MNRAPERIAGRMERAGESGGGFRNRVASLFSRETLRKVLVGLGMGLSAAACAPGDGNNASSNPGTADADPSSSGEFTLSSADAGKAGEDPLLYVAEPDAGTMPAGADTGSTADGEETPGDHPETEGDGADTGGAGDGDGGKQAHDAGTDEANGGPDEVTDPPADSAKADDTESGGENADSAETETDDNGTPDTLSTVPDAPVLDQGDIVIIEAYEPHAMITGTVGNDVTSILFQEQGSQETETVPGYTQGSGVFSFPIPPPKSCRFATVANGKQSPWTHYVEVLAKPAIEDLGLDCMTLGDEYASKPLCWAGGLDYTLKFNPVNGAKGTFTITIVHGEGGTQLGTLATANPSSGNLADIIDPAGTAKITVTTGSFGGEFMQVTITVTTPAGTAEEVVVFEQE